MTRLLTLKSPLYYVQVLGHGTAVFEDLSSYIASLESCITRLEHVGNGDHEVTIYPGHGEFVGSGIRKLKEYVKHRLEREAQVVEGLKKTGEAEESLTAEMYVVVLPLFPVVAETDSHAY